MFDIVLVLVSLAPLFVLRVAANIGLIIVSVSRVKQVGNSFNLGSLPTVD